MSGPIQILPRGLLGWLQLKQQGTNPSQLADFVQPTLDLTPHYREQQAQVLDQNSGISLTTGNVGFVAWSPLSIIVPPNETWWVTAYDIATSTIVVADDTVFSCGIRYNTVGTIRHGLCPGMHAPSPPLSSVAVVNRLKRASCNSFWAPPGSELGVEIDALTAVTTITFNVNAFRYVPMRI
jgi:hypothetical protein